MNRLLLKPSKYLSSLREGYAAISLFIPFLKPISSIAAGEYPVGLDKDMDPEGTGSGPLGLVDLIMIIQPDRGYTTTEGWTGTSSWN